jgi:hypothetical protein
MDLFLIEYTHLFFRILIRCLPVLSWFISAGITAFICIQLYLWWQIVGSLVKGDADREDVLMLIPLYWIIPFIALLWREVPNAMKREPRR